MNCQQQVFFNLNIKAIQLKYLLDKEMFKGGKLLGEYKGPAKDGEWIVVDQEGQSPEGRYVLLQKNNEGLDEDDWQLHVAEFAAFGRFTGQVFTECEGWYQPEIIFSKSFNIYPFIDSLLFNSQFKFC